MRPSVPSGRVALPRVVLRFSKAHEPVIESTLALLRSPLAPGVGPDGPMVWRSPRVRESSPLRRVPKRLVASALSPKPSIGPALAALRRAVAAKTSARLAARLAGLAGPAQNSVEEQRSHVLSKVFVFAGSSIALGHLK
jgi:hypothetical protein